MDMHCLPGKVAREETDEDEACDGHYEFFADGGTPELA